MDIKNADIHSAESLGQHELDQEYFSQSDVAQHDFAQEHQDQQKENPVSLTQDSVDTADINPTPIHADTASEDTASEDTVSEDTVSEDTVSVATEVLNQESLSPENTGLSQVTDNNVDKIRDILFGGNMRDYDKRFARLEDRLIADIERLSQDVFKRFENLDTFMRTEFESISHKLNLEKKERDDNLHELKNVQKRTDERITDVEQQHSAETRTLRITLHEQGNELLDMIRATHDELATLISKEARELQDVKVARSDLAELFSEFSLRLNRDFDLPEPPK